MRSARIAIIGGDALRSCVLALDFEPVDDRADVALVDLRDRGALERAASLPRSIPRVLIAGPAERQLCAAIGADATRIADSAEPAAIGPLLMGALPVRSRAATRVMVVTATRGGLGRTMFAAGLANRLAVDHRTAVVDVTGTGAAAWWLGADAQPWSAIAGLVNELTPEQLAIVAEEVRPGLRVIGGASIGPDSTVAAAVVRVAIALDQLVIVDAPLLSDPLTDALRASADRTLVLAYDDVSSLGVLSVVAPSEALWVIASQSRASRLGDHDVFRALPRDDGAAAAALASHAVSGGLGRAYDEIAELIRIDAA